MPERMQASHPKRSNDGGYQRMLEADEAYLTENSTTMTRRTLLAAPLAVILPKAPPAWPITCLPDPIHGKCFH
jgi:hypothetical protein